MLASTLDNTTYAINNAYKGLSQGRFTCTPTGLRVELNGVGTVSTHPVTVRVTDTGGLAGLRRDVRPARVRARREPDAVKARPPGLIATRTTPKPEDPRMNPEPVNRGSNVRALIVINAVLLTLLAGVTFAPAARAQARARGQYTMVAGGVNNSIDSRRFYHQQ